MLEFSVIKAFSVIISRRSRSFYEWHLKAVVPTTLNGKIIWTQQAASAVGMPTSRCCMVTVALVRIQS